MEPVITLNCLFVDKKKIYHIKKSLEKLLSFKSF